MSLHGLFQRRAGWEGAHLEHVLLDAERRLQDGDWNDGLRSLAHAFYVAATDGPQGLTDMELQRWVGRIFEAGRMPEGPGAA